MKNQGKILTENIIESRSINITAKRKKELKTRIKELNEKRERK